MLYEDRELWDIFGGCLRPGGLGITRQALQLMDLPAGARVADLGCGRGATLGLLNELGFAAVGLEKSEVLLKEAAARGRVMEGDFHHLPWPDESFDGLFCECALSLADDPRQVLLESGRVLKNRGWLAVSDLVRKGGGRGEGGGISCAAGAGTAAQLAAMLEEAGFTARHHIDHSQALNELAAAMVWRLGSLEALKKLFSLDGGGDCAPGRYGYSLIIAIKEAR